MKKIVPLILLTCAFISGCSIETSQKSGSNIEQSTQISDYAQEYSDIFDKIQTMNNDCTYLVGVYETRWSKCARLSGTSLIYGSPEDFMYEFDDVKMCGIPQGEEDNEWAGVKKYGPERKAEVAKAICPEALNEDGTDIRSGTEDMVNAACRKYQEALESIPNANAEIEEAIISLRTNYPDKSAEIDKLHNYYVESRDLAKFAPEPTEPSFHMYKESFNEMMEKIQSAKRLADIYYQSE